MRSQTLGVLILASGGCLLNAPARAAQVTAPAPDPTRGAITAPLEVTRTKHLAVQVRINGQGPFRLILDTGAPLSFVSGRLAAKVGLIKQEAANRPAFFGMRGQSVLKSVDIGGAAVKDLGVMILDHPIVQALEQVDAPLDGIIGFSFFARYRTTLDYQAGKVTFLPVKYVPEDVMTGILARLSNPGVTQTRGIAPAALWGFDIEKKDAGDETAGVRVSRVYPGSAADAAGLRKDDRLLTLDGRWTESASDTWEAAARVKPHQETVITVRRGEEELELRVRPRAGL